MKRLLLVVGSLVVISFFGGAYGLWYHSYVASQTTQLTIGRAQLTARVARSDAERTEGLSGTSGLGNKSALLFVFPSSGPWGIWMKEMNYPIDIAWLDENKVVKYVVYDATPDSYPSTTFRPSTPAKYVIETKSGTLRSSNITMGTQATFDDSKGAFR